MDVYILPKHIWGKMSADARGKYAATDGVGSGPFVLEKFEKGQFARFKANKYYWAGKPAVDEVVLRKFNNPDTMVAALKTGEIDAAEDVPGAAFDQLAKDDSIQTVEGNQGAMSEIAINGGDGLKKPHPPCSTRGSARRSPTPSTRRHSSRACSTGTGRRPTP